VDALLTGLAQGRSSHELATVLAAAGAPQQQHQHFASGLQGQGDPFQVAGCFVSLVSRFSDLSIGHWSRCNQGGLLHNTSDPAVLHLAGCFAF